MALLLLFLTLSLAKSRQHLVAATNERSTEVTRIGTDYFENIGERIYVVQGGQRGNLRGCKLGEEQQEVGRTI